MGTTSTVPSPMMRSTTTISTRVKPAGRRRATIIRGSPRVAFPARHVPVVAVAARRAVGAVGVEVVGPSALAGAPVVVRTVPGILRDVLLLEIRSVPAIEPEWPLVQRGEPLLRRRIAADVQPEGVERRAERLDLDGCGLHLGLLLLADEPRADDPHQETDDDEHHHDLDEREPGLSRARVHAAPHIGRSLTLKIAESIEMTMKPMPTPMTRISAGSRRRVNCVIATRTSRSK